MQEKKRMNLLKYAFADDSEFFDKFLGNLSEEELQKFLNENPDFLKE